MTRGIVLPEKPKIAVIGYSGSGKSTLSEFLLRRFGVPALHLDTVHFLPGWVERSRDEELVIVREFLDKNSENGWVIDGNYSDLEHGRRMDEADLIIFMDFNRISCFIRARKRARLFKGKARPSMTEGCEEKFDREFRRWILWDGRNKKRRKRFEDIVEKYSEKIVVIKNQRQLDKFIMGI